MSKYQIEFTKSAEKELNKLPFEIGEKILNKIDALETNPFPAGYKKLKQFSFSNYSGNFFRIRVGKYRIIYTLENAVLNILVVRIAHRKEVYE